MCFGKCDKWMGEKHKNPINCFLHLVAVVIVIYALWIHSIPWILIGVLVAVIGHIIQEVGKNPGKKEKIKKKRRKRK